MYVGASPSKLDVIRKKAFSGQIGKTIKEDYEPLTGVEASYYTNLVPEYLDDKNGNPREPTKEEIVKWGQFIKDEIEKVKPVAIVALGKTAGTALGDLANEWVPHPRALRIWGNAGEIDRKLSRLAKNVSAAPKPTKDTELTKIEEVPIFKTDEERQIVYGVVMEPYENDTDKNWSTPDEIEKAAHHFMEWWREHDTEHTKESIDAVPVESWVSPVDMTVNDQPVKKGSWVMGVHIRDEDQWEKVKAGEYAGFSIEAFANIDINRTLESELG
jgi:uracil-DNA glycosylase